MAIIKNVIIFNKGNFLANVKQQKKKKKMQDLRVYM